MRRADESRRVRRARRLRGGAFGRRWTPALGESMDERKGTPAFAITALMVPTLKLVGSLEGAAASGDRGARVVTQFAALVERVPRRCYIFSLRDLAKEHFQ